MILRGYPHCMFWDEVKKSEILLFGKTRITVEFTDKHISIIKQHR